MTAPDTNHKVIFKFEHNHKGRAWLNNSEKSPLCAGADEQRRLQVYPEKAMWQGAASTSSRELNGSFFFWPCQCIIHCQTGRPLLSPGSTGQYYHT